MCTSTLLRISVSISLAYLKQCFFSLRFHGWKKRCELVFCLFLGKKKRFYIKKTYVCSMKALFGDATSHFDGTWKAFTSFFMFEFRFHLNASFLFDSLFCVCMRRKLTKDHFYFDFFLSICVLQYIFKLYKFQRQNAWTMKWWS